MPIVRQDVIHNDHRSVLTLKVARSVACLIAFTTFGLATSTAATEPTTDGETQVEQNDWTVLYYGGSDNDSEESFCPDIEDMRRGLSGAPGLEVLCLVDRSDKFSSTTRGFGEDFHDTRLYRLTHDAAERLDGGKFLPKITKDSNYEADSGDASLLRDYIRYAKAHHPAKHYALIFYTHGNGWTFCPDETDGGELYPSELSETLSAEESLDLVVFDVCEMSSLEDVWQWRHGADRFSIDVMVATPMAGFPFPWNEVFRRIRLGSSEDEAKPWFAPSDLTAQIFGKLVVEETSQHRAREFADPGHDDEIREMIGREAMACVDVSKAVDVKRALDRLATAIFEMGEDDSTDLMIRLRGTEARPKPLHYTSYYVDVFDMAKRLCDDEEAPESIRGLASDLAGATDAMIVASFGGESYAPSGGFVAGQNGVQLVFPPFGVRSREIWKRIGFLSPDRVEDDRFFGLYDFCGDGAVRGDGRATNWYELLDAIFDPDDEDGGLNGYVR